MHYAIESRQHLGAREIHAVRELIRRATSHDDLAPLSEHVLLHLDHGGDRRGEHLLVLADSDVIAYLHLDQTDHVDGPSAELVVDPRFRQRGIGTALVRAAQQRAGKRLRLWAHGELAGAHALAMRMGYNQTRELWHMRRSLLAGLPKANSPAGVVIRNFEVGHDESAWLAANALVFADHPEQGRLNHSDLDARLAEEWFSPEGFLVAVSGEEIVGFHWTKVHGGQGAQDHSAIGEIYVLGVVPHVRGTGLGRYLAIQGLEHLRDLGLAAAMLYVDVDNAHARALYEGIGFMHWDSDVMFSRG